MNKQRVLISAFLCAFLALNPPITSFGEESDPSCHDTDARPFTADW